MYTYSVTTHLGSTSYPLGQDPFPPGHGYLWQHLRSSNPGTVLTIFDPETRLTQRWEKVMLDAA